MSAPVIDWQITETSQPGQVLLRFGADHRDLSLQMPAEIAREIVVAVAFFRHGKARGPVVPVNAFSALRAGIEAAGGRLIEITEVGGPFRYRAEPFGMEYVVRSSGQIEQVEP